MLNNNTITFWNTRLKKRREILFNSPVFLHKNQIVLNYLKNINKNAILDIGVGNGYIEELINKKFKNINLFAIDISHYSINELSKKYKRGFKIGNIKKIPFKGKKFNVIMTLDILEHLKTDELNRAMLEITRVLKKKGCLIISVPVNENINDSKSNRHLTEFNYEKLITLLKKYRFEVIKYEYLYAFPNYYYIKTFITKLFKLSHIKPNLLVVKAIRL